MHFEMAYNKTYKASEHLLFFFFLFIHKSRHIDLWLSPIALFIFALHSFFFYKNFCLKQMRNTFRSNIHQYHILYRSFIITFYLFAFGERAGDSGKGWLVGRSFAHSVASGFVYTESFWYHTMLFCIAIKCGESHKSVLNLFPFAVC